MIINENKRGKWQLYLNQPRKIKWDHKKIRNILKCLYKIFGNFLKSETIFKLIKIAQINRKKIKNRRSQNKILKKIQKVRNNGNGVDEFFQNLKMFKSIF